MVVEITSDAYEDALPDGLLNELYDKEFSQHFKGRNYGNNDIEIFMVIVCYPKEFKPRIRLDRKDKVLYWDVIINYQKMKKANYNEKKLILSKEIIQSFDILDNYEKLQINKENLILDTFNFFKEIGWLN